MMPKTPEQAEEVSEVAAAIRADPEKKNALARLTGGLRRVDTARLTVWTVWVLLAWVLLFVYSHQVPEADRPEYNVAVLALLAAMADGIKDQK